MTGPDQDGAVPRWPNWLGLVVDDLDAARRFYGEVLGLEAIDAGDDWVQFDMGEHRIFELLRRDSEQAQYERARFQPGFEVGDIHRARERLVALGARQVTEIEGGPEHGGYWCYFRDPEGHVFEISQSTPPVASAP
jgi:catechol 2,3-dioxygenase-like lactoylglutathione lyase family enzyme